MRFQTVLAAVLPALVIAAPTPQDPDYEFPADVPEEGIVGGTAARAGEFPFIVSLRRASGQHFCGGTLLNANTVITAAHCSVPNALGGPVSGITVRAGSLSRTSGGTVVGVRSITINPSYNDNSQSNDIAVWKLSTSIPTSSTVGYVRLPAAGSDPAAGTTGTVAGWGTLSSNGASPVNLMRVDVPVVARATCNAQYARDPEFGANAITTSMICAGFTAGGRDSCQGDSGGPFVDASNTLIGVVSWGKGCAVANFPGVYTRTANFISFINANA